LAARWWWRFLRGLTCLDNAAYGTIGAFQVTIDLHSNDGVGESRATLQVSPVRFPDDWVIASAELLEDSRWRNDAPLGKRVSVEAGLVAASPELSPAWLWLLQNARAPVRLSTVRWLGERGTVQAVPALRALEASAALARAQVKACQEAVLRIQSRLQNAEAGAVSIDDTARGALSEPTQEA
jgi:hypothetical protein